MRITVENWSKAPEEEIKDLFMYNPFPFFRGTPLGNDEMKRYMFQAAQKSAAANADSSFVVSCNKKCVAAGQIYRIPYLSEFWGMPIGAVGHILTHQKVNIQSRQGADILVHELVKAAKKKKIRFISAIVPGPNICLVQALEKNGFRYAEGFINMTGTTNKFRDRFKVSGLKIREAVEKDFAEIQDAYSRVTFPSRFATDPGFDVNKALSLYSRRFKEVYEQKIGKIFVAELNNKFAGAIIAIIDEDIQKATGIKTNILSGMGIIIHPRASRKGVSLALIEHRQNYYKNQSVEHVSFGANFNNKAMVLGLLKLGLTFGSLDMTFHNWLSEDN